MSLTLKVARRFYASYFSLNDVILFGKYKNHRGRIVAFSQDKWGNPTIEVEPIPKGRKQNKVIGLFRIWRADVKENAMKKLLLEKQAGEPMDSTKRVVARYLKVAGIDVGRTYVSAEDNVRIHRFSDILKVWDLTNAGKRGKTVDGFVLSTTYNYKGDAMAWLDNMGKTLPQQGDYKHILSLIRDIQHDFPGEIEMREFKEKGIEVLPASSAPIQLTTDKGLEISANPLEFSVKSVATFSGPENEKGERNTFKQDTNHWSRNKKDALLFYTWLKANLSKANKMDINDMKKIWHSEGIQYDSH